MGRELWTARHVSHKTGLSGQAIKNALASGALVGVPVKNGDGPLRHVFQPSSVRRWIREQTATNHLKRGVYVLAGRKMRTTQKA